MSGGSVDKHVVTPPTKPLPAGGKPPPGVSDVVMVKGEGLGGVLPQQFQSGSRYLPSTGQEGPSSNSSSGLANILNTSSPPQLTEGSNASGKKRRGVAGF